MNVSPKTIGIVAGETSGDMLGASLIHYCKQRYPQVQFVGIGGPAMAAAGCDIIYSMDALSIVGVVEIIKKLPTLWRLFRGTVQCFKDRAIDCYIGIDNPDFNLRMAKAVKKRLKVPTIQYGSPTIWAWRKGRLKTMERYVDNVLTLLPFEVDCYSNSKVKARFVGHPLADAIPIGGYDKKKSREILGLNSLGTVVAILPGSRSSEIKHLTAPFLKAAEQCWQQDPTMVFMVPMVNEERRQQFLAIKEKVVPQLPMTVVIGQAQRVMAAADVVLLSSGTATLEAMLLGKPMVVAYKFSWMNAMIARLFIRISYMALPNLLLAEGVVPELLQSAVEPTALAKALCEKLENKTSAAQLKERFVAMHHIMQRDPNRCIEEVLQEEGVFS